jgi:DNA-binding transcriptional LysR family regulator
MRSNPGVRGVWFPREQLIAKGLKSMDTDFFLEFDVLAEFENYSEAAEQLLISESTLSRHIRSLEDELGIRLFDRTSRKVRINEYGKAFLPYARQFITMQHQYSHDIERIKNGKDTVFICSFYYIDDFLFEFHAFDSNTVVSSLSDDTGNFDRWPNFLQRGACELVFVINPVDKNNEFAIIPFETDYYVAVLPAAHPFASRKSLPLSELSGENFISFKNNTHSDRELKELCRKVGYTPKIVFNTDTGSAISSFVRDGLGISILLKKTLSKMNVHGVVLVDIEPEASINVCICYPKTAKLSKGAGRLLQFVTEKWPEVKGKKR